MKAAHASTLLISAFVAVNIVAASRMRDGSSLRKARALTWSNLYLSSHHFVGQWHGQQYQAEVWARNVCLNTTHNMVRLLVSIHDAPFIRTNNPGPHSETPYAFLANTSSNGASILPKVWFEGPDGFKVYARGLRWDEYRTRVPSGAAMAVAELKLRVPHVLRLQGSDREHQLSVHCTAKRHPVFARGKTWLGVVQVASDKTSTQPTAVLQRPQQLQDGQHQPKGHRMLLTEDNIALHRYDGSSSEKPKHRTDRVLAASFNDWLNQPPGTGNTEESHLGAHHKYRHPLSVERVISARNEQQHAAGISGNGGVAYTTSSSNINHVGSQAQPSVNLTLDQGHLLQFLVLQHLQHHTSVGFEGTLMVATPHTASSLLLHNKIRDAVMQRKLVLVAWDSGLEAKATHFIQLPAINLLRMAAWGSGAHLAFFDLDEYLVLPQQKSITEEIADGCLSAALAHTLEAIIPNSWVHSKSWKSGPEALGWLQYGSWQAAISSMDYEVLPYSYCDGVCKAVVNPDADLVFQVHQYARPSPKAASPVDRTCAYLLHFHNLWAIRTPTIAFLPSKTGSSLQLKDVGL